MTLKEQYKGQSYLEEALHGALQPFVGIKNTPELLNTLTEYVNNTLQEVVHSGIVTIPSDHTLENTIRVTLDNILNVNLSYRKRLKNEESYINAPIP